MKTQIKSQSEKHIAGTLAVMASSLLFGATPILARMAYAGGSNFITMTFLRALLALPVLFIILKVQKIPMGLTKKEALRLLVVGLFGSVATTLCLYASYNYIPVGMATTLHFVYPLIVSLAGMLLYGEKMTLQKGAALALGLFGIVLFAEGTSAAGILGVGLALLSAFTFSFKVIQLGKPPLLAMHSIKVVFYLCLVECLGAGGLGLASGQLVFSLTPVAWLCTILVAMLLSVVAVPLLKYGISHVGSAVAAILSTLEPITSVVCGVLFLQETLTVQKIIGCILVLAGVLCITLRLKRPKNGPTEKKDEAVAE